MNELKLTRIIIYFMNGFFVAQTAWYFPNLPQNIVTHFNAFGEPDGWMQKNNFLIFEAVFLFSIISLFSIVPFLIGKMPDSPINLPSYMALKSSWQRRTQTALVVRVYFEWLSIALAAMFIGINQLVFRANISGKNISPGSWLIIGTFIIFVILWMIKFVRQFKIEQ